ncbi:DNA-binding SARP family transcriptional activator [Streptacidiphilus sp. MAP12-33]|uniref:AfsR/SARP family transcriptional regulator n=1 Tax=Streptacidiphilus sp. MAP12-33 TaxID=3156266 RepID=UPI003514E1A7
MTAQLPSVPSGTGSRFGGSRSAEIRLLGPLTVVDRRGEALPVAPKPRVVLALLASRVQRAVSATAVAEELWGEEPPKSAQGTVQTYVAQLRRSLAQATGLSAEATAERVLVTEGGGYRLADELLQIDTLRFTALDHAGRSALRRGCAQEGRELLSGALTLWRGAPLVNVACGIRLGALLPRLEEERLAVQEARLVADLEAGDHYSVVGELLELSAQHPLNESLCGLLMLALYRGGRRAEALTVLRDLRDRLVAELGLEPGDNLLRLQTQILRGDPALDLPTTGRIPQPRLAS